MSMPSTVRPRLTMIQWLICFIAVIGFAFDTFVLLMLPLILKPALLEFGITPGSPEFTKWRALLFFLPAVVGGIVGLLGGYLTDRLGRRRILTWSILIYAFSAFAASYSTSVQMLLVFRCTIIHRRLCRIRRRRGLASRVVSQSASARTGAWLHPGMQLVRWSASRRRQRPAH